MENSISRLKSKKSHWTQQPSTSAEGEDQTQDEIHVINKLSDPPSLFMPLTGKEDALRLEDKYGLLHSDEEDREAPYRIKGKISQWKIQDSPSKWLNSQSSRKCQNINSHDKSRHSPHKHQSNRSTINAFSPEDTRTATQRSSSGIHSDVDLHTKLGTSNSKEAESDGEDNFYHEGFSLGDTERPKFHIQPPAAKVAFRLSDDSVQLPVMVPASINQYLRDYQREGIRFLYQHYAQRKGAILGDDMGLGKTIQVIGFLAALLGKQGNHRDAVQALPKFIRQLSETMSDSPPRTAKNPFLIIGPSAVMFNWLDELTTWGYFTARKFHGGDKDSCLSDLKKGKLEIIVTTFETFRDNADKLQNVEWEAVIVDEVHKIKDMKAQITKALSLINTPCRYGLTGTALQNNMTELFCILNWAWPGILGSPEEFSDLYVHVMEAGQRQDATKRELAQARKQKEKFAEIRQRVMLRRTKALLKDQLPTKEDLVVMCRLTDLQVSVYKAILTHPDMDLVLRAEDPCECRRGKPRASCCYKYANDGTKTWALILSYMHLLLKAANHCALLIPNSSETHKTHFKRAREVCEHALKDYPQFVEQTRTAAFMTLSDLQYCGKMKILHGLLTLFSAAHDKVLVFSYSTRLLDIIEHYVMSKCHTYRRIDGKTSSQKRLEIVQQFNSDPDIFLCLISTKAGGIGLNLTGANRVIIFDPNWNPSHDLQAQDRAFRIGQTRNVQVYRLVSAGTIEENIYLRQLYKQQLNEVAVSNKNAKRLFQGIQGDKSKQGELFGVKNMFSLRTGNTCLTMDILQRNERLEKGLEKYDITRYIPPKPNKSKSMPDSDEEESVQESDEADSEQDIESGEEEDSSFFESIFRKNRIDQSDGGLKPSAYDKLKSGDPKGSDLHQQSSSNLEDQDNEFEDEEFSLIPTLYPRARLDDKNRNIKERSDFTLEDITFSKSALHTVTDVDLKYKGHASSGNKCSALSLIFSESESDEMDVEDDETEKRPSAFKDPATISSSNPSKGRTLLKTAPSRGSKRKKEEANVSSKGRKVAKCDGAQIESVNAVFEACGVLHTHKNRQVVGSSRAEDHMTNCATKDVFELHTNSQDPAMQCDPLPMTSNEKTKKRKKVKKAKEDHNSAQSVKSGSTKILLGQTPPGVQRQHWTELCKFNRSDPLEVAEKLVTSTPEERLEMLQRFYSHLHSSLKDTLTNLLQVKSADDTVCSTKSDMTENGTKPQRSHKLKSTSKSKTNHHQMDQENDISTSKQKHRKNMQRRRQLSPCLLAQPTCLSLESQESLTAMSPPIEPPSSDDHDSEGFSPVPVSKGKRRLTKLKSPASKSKSATYCRQKASNELARRNLFSKNRGRGLCFSSDSGEDEDDRTVTFMTTNMPSIDVEPGHDQEEDVSTLLTEMAGGEYYQRFGTESNTGLKKNMNERITKKSGFGSNSGLEKLHISLENDPLTVHNSPSCTMVIESQSVATPQSKNEDKTQALNVNDERKDSTSAGKKQNYASLLDDIFSSNGNTTNNNQETVIVTSHITEKTVSISEKSSTSISKKSKGKRREAGVNDPAGSSPVRVLPWNAEKSSYDAPLEANTSHRTNKQTSHENETSCEENEGLSIFDSLFKMSTLNEETVKEKDLAGKKKRKSKFCMEGNKEVSMNSDKNVSAVCESQSLFS